MKKFLSAILIFFTPILILLIIAELYIIYYPNTFNSKAFFLKKNLNSVQVLILGSSHNQNDIDPEYIHLSTSNLAYGDQDMQIDSALFFKYIGSLKSLKYIILEIDYHTLMHKNHPDYFRFPWYYKYYKIQLYPIELMDKVSLYFSNMSFFNNYIGSYLNPLSFKYEINKYGFVENDFPGYFKDLNYDTVKIMKNSFKRLAKLNDSAYNFNKSKFISIVNYCVKKNLNILLVSDPMYKSYTQAESKSINIKRESFIDSLLKISHKLFYYDFESCKDFVVKDFKNDDHLNSAGAKKFTLRIDSILHQMK